MSRSTSKRFRQLLACALALVGFAAQLSAQQVTVRGRVVNAQDEPIAGASVAVPGTTATTTTDAEGRFTLAVPGPTATLSVSRVGYGTGEVPLNGRTDVVVQLTESAIQLEALVVVGYGTQKKSDVTGSVVSIDADALEQTSNTTVTQTLAARLPGVSVTETAGGAEPRTNLVIRGRNSITASNAPLVVIDGIPYDGSISEINQNDIASIEVLKDASAAAIYGSRGSNGVILITSKKGSGEPRISYDGYVGAADVAHLPRLMNGLEFAAFKCERLSGGQNCESVLTPTELANLQDGKFTNWVDLATHTGLQQQHNLSFSGGTDATQYYVAGSLLNVGGVAKSDEFNRYTLRVNLNQEVKSWLEMGTATQLSWTDRDGLPASFDDAFRMNPLTNPYEADGRLTVYPWPDEPFFGNPLQGTLAVNDDKRRRVFTSNFAQVDLPFMDGLSYRLNGGLDFSARDLGRYYGGDTRIGDVAQGVATTNNTTQYQWTLENILRLTRTFGKHSVDVTTLYSRQGSHLDTESLVAEGFPNDVLTYHQADVARLVVPSDAVTETGLISQMGRVNYSYDGRYLVTLTARRDGFSGFGRNNKYGVFPSLALGWNVARESFWPFADNFQTLKLRLSYGRNGNQAIDPYQTLSRLREQSYLNGELTAPGYLPATLGNPDLKWEETTTLNAGVDFGLVGNRVSGSLDVYSARTGDLLLDRAISPVHGITRITENIGETQNRGIELDLHTINVDRDAFGWSTDFNISANRNEILELYGNGEDDVLNQWFIGNPIDVNFGYKYNGIWQEGDDIANSAQPKAQPGDVRVLDLNGDGTITPDDRTFLGSLQPSFSAGLNNSFRLGQFGLSFLFQSVQGLSRANPLLTLNQVGADVRQNTVFLPNWTPENPNTIYPQNRQGSNPFSVGFYQDASFTRLKDLTLSYDVPSSLSDYLGLGALRLYVNGRNLWTRSSWTGLDPELDNSSQRGIPLERVLIGGVNFNF